MEENKTFIAQIHSLHLNAEKLKNNKPLNEKLEKSVRLMIWPIKALILCQPELQTVVKTWTLPEKTEIMSYKEFLYSSHQIFDEIATVVMLGYPEYDELVDVESFAAALYQGEFLTRSKTTEIRYFGNSLVRKNVSIYKDKQLQDILESKREDVIQNCVAKTVYTLPECTQIILYCDIPIPNMPISAIVTIDELIEWNMKMLSEFQVYERDENNILVKKQVW